VHTWNLAAAPLKSTFRTFRSDLSNQPTQPQQWFDLSDPAAEDAIYDSESMRRFAKIELSEDKVPDETTILGFLRLLETHGLTRAIFTEIGALLEV
jgi:hypothetical protein